MFVLEIWDDQSDKVTFYTVRYEDSSISETDDFHDRYSDHPEYKDSLDDLLSLIFDTIGNKYGAIDEFFRPEDTVEAIPPRGRVCVDEIELYYPQFPLRLYALRIQNRKDIVVLFNGDIKTGKSNLDSGKLNMKFLDAKNFASKIVEAINDGTILVNDNKRRLELFDGNSEIYL